jgi:hypothetical protein
VKWLCICWSLCKIIKDARYMYWNLKNTHNWDVLVYDYILFIYMTAKDSSMFHNGLQLLTGVSGITGIPHRESLTYVFTWISPHLPSVFEACLLSLRLGCSDSKLSAWSISRPYPVVTMERKKGFHDTRDGEWVIFLSVRGEEVLTGYRGPVNMQCRVHQESI